MNAPPAEARPDRFYAFLTQARERGLGLRELAEGLYLHFGLAPAEACEIVVDWLRRTGR